MDDINLSLVQRAVAGEKAAMEQIMRTLERVAPRLSQFQGNSQFSTWAWRVAIHRILEIKRGPAFTFAARSSTLRNQPEQLT